MNKLTRADIALIKEFERVAKILLPVFDQMHEIHLDKFVRGGLDHCDFSDYFRIHEGEFESGMAEVISETIKQGIKI